MPVRGLLLFAFAAIVATEIRADWLEKVRLAAGHWTRCRSLIGERREAPQSVAMGGRELPVPFGVEPAVLTDIIPELFATEPVSLLALFGSRTHFSHGYLPDSASDLDVFVMIPFEYDPSPIRRALGEASRDFVVSVIVRQRGRLQFSTEPEFHFPPTFEAERSLYREAELRTAFRIWRYPSVRMHWREIMFERDPQITDGVRRAVQNSSFFRPFSPPLTVNKEAIIFVRDDDTGTGIKNALEARDFRNVVMVSPGASR